MFSARLWLPQYNADPNLYGNRPLSPWRMRLQGFPRPAYIIEIEKREQSYKTCVLNTLFLRCFFRLRLRANH